MPKYVKYLICSKIHHLSGYFRLAIKETEGKTSSRSLADRTFLIVEEHSRQNPFQFMLSELKQNVLSGRSEESVTFPRGSRWKVARIASATSWIFQSMARKSLLDHFRRSPIILRWRCSKVIKTGLAKLFGDAPTCWVSSLFSCGSD